MKKQRKKQAKKTRQDVIIGTTKGEVSNITVNINEDGTVQIEEIDPETLRLERSYKRDSGKDKIISSIQSKGPTVSFDTWPELKKSFDYLIAVDTNTRNVGGRRLSVTISLPLSKTIKRNGRWCAI